LRAAGPSAAELARTIHEASLDPEQCYRVRDLSYRKEDIKLYFTDGYLIFSKPVAGQPLSAVFTTDVEGGDGEIILLPPSRGERKSMAEFTQSPNLDEHLRAALLVFTDGTGTALLADVQKQETVKKMPEVGALMSERWSPVLRNIREGFELRMVDDLLSPDARKSGFLFMGLSGRERGNFDVLFDPRGREQIVAGQIDDRGTRPHYNIWTSFQMRSVRKGAAVRPDSGFSLTRFSINATLDQSLHLKATTTVKLKVGAAARRSFPFEITSSMKVTAVRVDGAPAEAFARDSAREHALRGSDDNAVLVVTPEALPPASEHEFSFEHEGDVIASAGNGVYFVSSRSTWYPRGAPEFSTYDLTFHYPKKLTLVTPGDVLEDHTEGEIRTTRRATPVPVRFAGFNLGDYQRISTSAHGLTIEVYGNRQLDPGLQSRQDGLPEPSPRPMTAAQRRAMLQEESQRLTFSPDPLARLHSVASNVASSVEFLSGLFGPAPLKTLTVSPIPGTFGQGFPGLVYLSTVAYLDPAARPAGLRGEAQKVFFSDLMVAHEVAHQWWGNAVITSSYQDEWLMEALSNYSALMWLEKKSGTHAMEMVLDDYRSRLLTKFGGPEKEPRTVESAGPIVWGVRLDASGVPDAWRSITYEKGAWIMHMLRRRMGDERFLKMLAELRKRYDTRSVNIDEFQKLAEEFGPHSPSDTMEAFFDNWVYATGIPALKLQSSIHGLKVTGTIEQSGVDNDFSIDVPVEIQFAKGPPQIVWVRSSSEAAPFSVTLKAPAARVVLGLESALVEKK
jgi:hypothetical protein